MTIATPVKTSVALAIGLGKIYLDDSATHITEFNQVLGATAYVGAAADISFVATREILEQGSNAKGFREIVQRLVLSAQVSLKCDLLELTTKNMSYSFGGDGGVGNILNDLFEEPSILRAELVFLYPNKIDQMIIVLPSVQVVSGPSLGFKSDGAIPSSITLSSVATDEVTWTNDPLGRVYWP
ncbi:MAG: hypothetical protein U9R60_16345 [Bacteroidota bacterium]|nr:hypothetical protein [Bacteroidota bacterium]